MRATLLLLLLAACAHDQELSVRYKSKIFSERDAYVCRYYERKLIELYRDQARAAGTEAAGELEAEAISLEKIFEARCISPD